MKGDYEFLNITFALIIFMGTIVLIVLMIRGNILSFSGGVASDVTQINAIEASHMVEYCFTSMEGGDSENIATTLLDKYNGKSIAEICKIDKPEIKVEIIDMENEKKWSFGTVSKSNHEIWVSIIYENAGVKSVNMGKMNVEI